MRAVCTRNFVHAYAAYNIIMRHRYIIPFIQKIKKTKNNVSILLLNL